MGLIENLFASKRKPEPIPSPQVPPNRTTTGNCVVNGHNGIHQDKKWSLEDFEVFRTLGVGSFGRVQLVRCKASNSYYAMKRMRKVDIVRQKQVEHTNDERALLGKTSGRCPFLVHLVCSFQDTHHLYLVMEYVCGGELFSLLRKVKCLPAFVAVFYAAEVVLAFEFLHAQGVIYRDLKPENMVIHQDGHVRIIDFGFAKDIRPASDITYTLCGTPDYLAPEILKQQGYTFAVDWWSLGVLIYEMLTGYPPFQDQSHLKLYEKIKHSQPHYPPSLDDHSQSVIGKLLVKDPTQRLGSSHRGAQEIKEHPFFAEVNWTALWSKNVKPPYKPPIKSPDDTSAFDEYPEENINLAEIESHQVIRASLFPEF